MTIYLQHCNTEWVYHMQIFVDIFSWNMWMVGSFNQFFFFHARLDDEECFSQRLQRGCTAIIDSMTHWLSVKAWKLSHPFLVLDLAVFIPLSIWGSSTFGGWNYKDKLSHIWLVVWNHWILWLSHHIGNVSTSQLTFTPWFFRGVGLKPPTRDV